MSCFALNPDTKDKLKRSREAGGFISSPSLVGLSRAGAWAPESLYSKTTMMLISPGREGQTPGCVASPVTLGLVQGTN